MISKRDRPWGRTQAVHLYSSGEESRLHGPESPGGESVQGRELVDAVFQLPIVSQ